MVVPLILGKISYDLLDGGLNVAPDDIVPVTAGFLAAFLSGIIACKWMIQLVSRSRLWYFAIYCALVGIFAIVFA